MAPIVVVGHVGSTAPPSSLPGGAAQYSGANRGGAAAQADRRDARGLPPKDALVGDPLLYAPPVAPPSVPLAPIVVTAARSVAPLLGSLGLGLLGLLAPLAGGPKGSGDIRPGTVPVFPRPKMNPVTVDPPKVPDFTIGDPDLLDPIIVVGNPYVVAPQPFEFTPHLEPDKVPQRYADSPFIPQLTPAVSRPAPSSGRPAPNRAPLTSNPPGFYPGTSPFVSPSPGQAPGVRPVPFRAPNPFASPLPVGRPQPSPKPAPSPAPFTGPGTQSPNLTGSQLGQVPSPTAQTQPDPDTAGKDCTCPGTKTDEKRKKKYGCRQGYFREKETGITYTEWSTRKCQSSKSKRR